MSDLTVRSTAWPGAAAVRREDMPPACTPRSSPNPLVLDLFTVTFTHSPQPQGQVAASEGAVMTPEPAKQSSPATSALLGLDVMKHPPRRPLHASTNDDDSSSLTDYLHPDTLKPTRLTANTPKDRSPASGGGNSPSPPPAARISPNPLALNIFIHSDAAAVQSMPSGAGVVVTQPTSNDGFKAEKDRADATNTLLGAGMVSREPRVVPATRQTRIFDPAQHASASHDCDELSQKYQAREAYKRELTERLKMNIAKQGKHGDL